ncbi:fibronectin type III domain-containing protein [Plantactinospora endophytica]|uniref:Fibronectin type-III domain-containing protein n=1 Tax=Plantactinospora endophytica TaxID=673535 RepID=A0ABQ4E1F9_9ACTN|nr:fibronectin type III domain-containing protein [Plantactinospora endophytica]GIG88555.1 hypothetical protein Pen02_34910 [Plantactinospora endophytica]
MDRGTNGWFRGTTGGRPARRIWVALVALVVLLAGSLVVVRFGAPFLRRSAQTVAAGPGMAAAELTALFSSYGNTSGRWSGADRTASVALPDDRLLWLFSDTFLGTVDANHARPRDSPFINNSAVVQRGRQLERTVHGGTPEQPTSLVPTGVAGEFYWVGDAVVDGANVRAVYNRYRRTGSGPLDFALLGSAMATFALPGLHLTEVRPLPLSDRVAWGSDLLTDGGYTYVYGSEPVDGMKFAHLARVPGTDLGGAWEFWTGTGWSGREAASHRLLSGVGTAYGVQRVGDRYVLLTQENNLVFSPEFVAYTASSPAGPFEGPVPLFRAPETDAGNIVYDAHLHPELARPGRLLVSYNVNSLDVESAYTDTRIYRPRFVEVDWPRPEPDPRVLPAAPTELRAESQGAGNAVLNWQAPAGAGHEYRIHRRDVTAGQSHFVRLPQSTSATSFSADFLVNGHTYEFRVSAANGAGEGPASNTATATATVPPPPAPANVRAVAGTRGDVVVHWAEIPLVQVFQVFYRDRTSMQRKPTLAGSFTGTSARIASLRHGHRYEFTVVAVGGGGTGPPSAPVPATAFVAPPEPPDRPTAVAAEDGTIRLSWRPVAPGLSYQVHRRDLTAGETAFTLVSPGGGGTEYTARLLEHDHEYEFVVRAVNQGGPGRASAPVLARSRYAAPATAPTGLRVVPGAGPGELAVDWKPTAGALGYWVSIRDVTAGQATFVRDEVPTLGTSTNRILLTSGHTYEVTVAAFNQGGIGPAATAVPAVVR